MSPVHLELNRTTEVPVDVANSLGTARFEPKRVLEAEMDGDFFDVVC